MFHPPVLLGDPNRLHRHQGGQVQLGGNAHTRAVELADEVVVLSVNPWRPWSSQNEVSSPEEGKGMVVHAQERQQVLQIPVDEGVHEPCKRGIVGLVSSVGSSALQRGGHSSLLWFLVQNLHRLRSDEQDTDLSLRDSRHEGLIDQLSSVLNASLEIPLSEREEFSELHVLDMVINSLCQLELSPEVQRMVFPPEARVLELHDPDPFSLRSPVLLHHPRAL
mmetsp:Transcript_16335/g.54699  ORF Transcript_16335/g.54699 Transcript_16335/m.54699 type:complete len:221 (-) Transcript_16335:782-1444(-)